MDRIRRSARAIAQTVLGTDTATDDIAQLVPLTGGRLLARDFDTYAVIGLDGSAQPLPFDATFTAAPATGDGRAVIAGPRLAGLVVLAPDGTFSTVPRGAAPLYAKGDGGFAASVAWQLFQSTSESWSATAR